MAGPGGVASPLGTMTVPPGDSVTISATANDGYAFTNWSLPYGSGTFANSFASNTTVVLTSTSATVRANFALIGMVLVRSASSVSVPEGGTHTFQLKLLSKPPVDIAVNVAPTAGDANITVTGGANLTFTTNNWDTYQTVTLAAAEDGDTVNGTTTITCSSPDADSTLVTATEVDNDTTLTVNAGTGGNTTPSGATVVTMDVATAITATASANYAFTNWSVTSGAATFANSNAASTMVTISAPATILANFVKTNINQTPVITEGASPNVTMSEDGAPTAFALTLHATDADGDTLTWSVATPAAHGTATASGTGASQAIAYTPTVNYSGADSFAIQVSDGVGGAATTTVAVTIQPVNDAPVAFDQSVSTAKNTAKAITLSGSDLEGSNLTYAVATQPAYGTLSGTGATRTYTPNPGYMGSDSFTFRVNDGALDSPPATVSILVTAVAATGGTVTNYTLGGTNWTAIVFTNYPVNEIPTMTTNNAPSGVASASSEQAANPAWKAMDQIGSTRWSSSASMPQWLQYQFASGKVINGYEFSAYSAIQNPSNFTLQASSDGSNWTILDTQTNKSATSQRYVFSNAVSYTYYRLNVTTVGGGGANLVSLNEFRLYSMPVLDVTSGGDVEYLVVAAGGAGGSSHDTGGGGAGGMLAGSVTLAAGKYPVFVGKDSSQESVFGTMRAIGGGAGANSSPGAGAAGGSGGGSVRNSAGVAIPGGAGTTGQGNRGGNGYSTGYFTGGGGGGAGGPGVDANGVDYISAGGPGLTNSISGAAVAYAAGGKGYHRSASDPAGKGKAGDPNTGNGGNGGINTSSGGAGGSGIVIVRYVANGGGGAVAPAAPTGLTATTVATNQINLAWIDQATNETGYVVNRSLDSTNWTFVTLTAVNATNYSNTGLTTNTLYYYRVAASNAAGISAYCFASARTWSVYEAWRQRQFGGTSLTNSAISGATADPDHDGLNNEQEYWAGTEPTNASSCLAIIAPTNNPVVAGGGFVVSWQSVTGKTYSVLAATNLLTGFSSLTNGLPATPTVNVYTDKVNGAGQKFYRVGVE
jgi:hypothetical protein